MSKKKILVTGSAGLIGSEVIESLYQDYDNIYGIDNNQRKIFFGSSGDIKKRKIEIQKKFKNYTHIDLDIRNRKKVLDLFESLKPDDVVHCAAQPSHDLAAKIPFDDFDINAGATLNILESIRKFCPKASIVYLSTNKVYGDGPNNLKIKELKTRYTFADPLFKNGISENFSIDHCKHSLFGASKLSADILVQEYGRYFNINSCCLRGGCLTGANHSGVELHGFLNYLIKCNIQKKNYTIFGYKGKQVRDNLHSRDVASFIRLFLNKPKVAEVYNLGGGEKNSISIIEAFKLVEKVSGIKMLSNYKNENRIGDHICYISDLSKIKKDFPEWNVTVGLKEIIEEIVEKSKYKR